MGPYLTPRDIGEKTPLIPNEQLKQWRRRQLQFRNSEDRQVSGNLSRRTEENDLI